MFLKVLCMFLLESSRKRTHLCCYVDLHLPSPIQLAPLSQIPVSHLDHTVGFSLCPPSQCTPALPRDIPYTPQLLCCKSAVIKMEVPIPFWILVFFSFDKYPEVELLGHMVVHCFFIFLRNLHTLFLIAVPVYILTNSVLSFPFSPFSENLLFVVFLMIAILTGGRSFLMVALICLSVMFNDV